MQSFLSLICAIEFIEEKLFEKQSVEAVAKAAYVSSSHLQKMFSQVFHTSVGDYTVKRRLCRSAHVLINTTRTITEVAMDCGYENTESFSRAFKKLFRVSPSVYRKHHRFSNLYPKFNLTESEVHEMKEGHYMVIQYDLSEISSKILASKETYIISVDIDHMMQINDTMGHETGDIAIAESSARIEKSLANGMDFFRISGDQFIILTGTDDLSVVEKSANDILSYSDDDVAWSQGTFTFSLSMGITLIPADLSNAKTAIEKADAAMYEAKKQGKNSYIVR